MIQVIAYSLHSNFSEIESLVKSIGPASLIALSRKSNENKKWEKVQEFSNYLISLMRYQQKGFGILVEKYVRVGNFSQEYKNLRVLNIFTSSTIFYQKDADFQKRLNLELGITLTAAEILEENTKMFEKQYQNILLPKKRFKTRKKYYKFSKLFPKNK